MIVPMKHLTLLCVASEGEQTLEDLRDLGCLQLDFSTAASAAFVQAKEDVSDAERAVRILAKAAKEYAGVSGTGRFDAVADGDFVAAVLAADRERQTLLDEAEKLRQTVRVYAPFGDFDPALAAALRTKGLSVVLAKGRKGLRPEAAAGGYVQRLGSDARADYFVCVNTAVPDGCEAVPLPAERLSATRKRLSALGDRIAAAGGDLAAAHARTDAITRQTPALKDKVDFAAARDALAAYGAVSALEGWIPVDAVAAVRAKAKDRGWGILVRDVADGENPPTLIRPPKLFRPVVVLFEGLGIAPAYTEADVSVPFMCYFSLFFAMLVGDGGYGAILLALALVGWYKTRPRKPGARRASLVSSWLALLTVFSTATIVWGLLSNTWFGEGLPCAQNWPTVKWLADPSYNNMMLLCFTIGVSHLMLARIWTGLCMLNDRTCLSQFGWAGILLFMYLVTNAIVGIFDGIPTWGYWMFGLSLVGVFGFTLKGREFKTRGIELGMLPLNIMSALGDIISYVRLFAVGLASVKVAQNFNMMATGLDWPLWQKFIPMVAILLIGHGLNFAMAGLSILVHAVRLNTLEFSSHKGISWSGYAYAPFRRH